MEVQVQIQNKPNSWNSHMRQVESTVKILDTNNF